MIFFIIMNTTILCTIESKKQIMQHSHYVTVSEPNLASPTAHVVAFQVLNTSLLLSSSEDLPVCSPAVCSVWGSALSCLTLWAKTQINSVQLRRFGNASSERPAGGFSAEQLHRLDDFVLKLCKTSVNCWWKSFMHSMTQRKLSSQRLLTRNKLFCLLT